MTRQKTTDQNSYRNQNLIAGIGLAFVLAAWPGSSGQAQGTQSLRNPLIPGVPGAGPMEPAQEGMPPPPGDGDTPLPVTPGDQGSPLPPPSAVAVPATSPLDKSEVNAAVAPYLTPPPSAAGQDPGTLPGTLSGYKPPALMTDVQPGGGLAGDAAVHKWDGQTTRDYGLRRPRGSQATDFGRPLDQVSVVRTNKTEDGPRPVGPNGAPTQPSMAGAQQTSDRYGARTLYKGANLRPVMTIAPY
jgi:hypothetical protein